MFAFKGEARVDSTIISPSPRPKPLNGHDNAAIIIAMPDDRINTIENTHCTKFY